MNTLNCMHFASLYCRTNSIVTIQRIIKAATESPESVATV